MPSGVEKFMRLALALAHKGEGVTFPNPCVGALLVRGGRIVGSGFHRKAGGPHAEITALKEAGPAAKGSTLFCTLEPCIHHGRTAPCVEALIASGIRKVCIGMVDPNPLVRGKGIAGLRRAGISVETGILEGECRRLNEPFVKAMTHGLPFVTVKIAESLDGKTATASGESKWITGDDSRRHARSARRLFDAILVGINTVLKDDPRLEPSGRGHRLAKVIVDSKLALPSAAHLFETTQPVFVAHVLRDAKREKELAERGAVLLPAKSKNGRVDLRQLLVELNRREIRSLLVEGGSEIAGSFLDEKLADKIMAYVALKVIGGRGALSSIGGRGVGRIKDAVRLNKVSCTSFDKDILIEAYLDYSRGAQAAS